MGSTRIEMLGGFPIHTHGKWVQKPKYAYINIKFLLIDKEYFIVQRYCNVFFHLPVVHGVITGLALLQNIGL